MGEQKRKKKKNKSRKSKFSLRVHQPLSLFWLSIFAFFLLSSVAVLGFGKGNPENVLGARTKNYVNAGPFLKDNPSLLPAITAESVYALDVDSGTELLSINASSPLLPASTTKIATALVSLSYYRLDDVLRVDDNLSVEGRKMSLVPGEEITVRNLLYGLLVFSANDAAEVLARNYPGGRKNFIEAMNRLASFLGMQMTHFANPTGLDQPLHFSTARDMAKLAVFAISNPVFATFVKTKKIEVRSTDSSITHLLTTTNELLGEVPGVIGIKTGYTNGAKEALITLVTRDGHRVLIAVFGSNDRFADTKKIINWVFENYKWL